MGYIPGAESEQVILEFIILNKCKNTANTISILYNNKYLTASLQSMPSKLKEKQNNFIQCFEKGLEMVILSPLGNFDNNHKVNVSVIIITCK